MVRADRTERENLQARISADAALLAAA